MKPEFKVTLLITAFLAASSYAFAPAASAAKLNIDSTGQLLGADGVDVGGTLYDVEFLDGTCLEVFNGCADFLFTFQSHEDSVLASSALANQVFGGPNANTIYDNDPSLTNGITDVGLGSIFTPHGELSGRVAVTRFENYKTESFDRVGCAILNSCTIVADISLTPFGNAVWASWSPVIPAPTPITIDIKPGSDPNPVNLSNKGVVLVAIMGSTDFDATQVDFSTVTFGQAEASPVHDGHVEDENGDGFVDMIFHFNTQDTGIVCGDSDATLTGETFGGTQFKGTDTVQAIGCE
jgi:hypothetical protein